MMARLFASVDAGKHDVVLIAVAVLAIAVGLFGERKRRREPRK